MSYDSGKRRSRHYHSGKLQEHGSDRRYLVGDPSLVSSSVVSQVAALRRPIVLFLAGVQRLLLSRASMVDTKPGGRTHVHRSCIQFERYPVQRDWAFLSLRATCDNDMLSSKRHFPQRGADVQLFVLDSRETGYGSGLFFTFARSLLPRTSAICWIRIS